MDKCDAKHVSWFQQLIGILRGEIKLRSIDIQIEVAFLSLYQASPQEGHIEALYLILHLMLKNPKKVLLMDLSMSDVDKYIFNLNADWNEIYGDVVEDGSHRMPEPLGRSVWVGYFIGEYHGGNVITRISHYGTFLFVKNTLIKYFSKLQNTVKSSTIGSDIVALKTERDMILEIKIKFKMFGVPFGWTRKCIIW